jgi:hypothetical protein
MLIAQSDADIREHCVSLLAKALLSTQIISIAPCAKGGNNRTYRLETVDGVFAVKQYFRQSGDTRDRLAAEFAFLTYAARVAPQWVPIPYSQDSQSGMALYEFVHGLPIKSGELTEHDIVTAGEFFCALNQASLKLQANDLPYASEACFSIQEHLTLVGIRVAALEQISADLTDDSAARSTIARLSERWYEVMTTVKHEADLQGIDLLAQLPWHERCLSPSDFGFHNALRRSDGTLCFLDFEYAGWDDPAKMIGDFFSQLAVPVPGDYFERFALQVANEYTDADSLMRRATLLRSVYRLKWCCIALNVFIPVNLARRQFANPDLNVSDLKRAQLAKAECLLQN